MIINNSIKKASCLNWCDHTDNLYGGYNKKTVRLGKRIMRKKLNTYLNKLLKYASE